MADWVVLVVCGVFGLVAGAAWSFWLLVWLTRREAPRRPGQAVVVMGREPGEANEAGTT